MVRSPTIFLYNPFGLGEIAIKKYYGSVVPLYVYGARNGQVLHNGNILRRASLIL